MGNKKYMSTIHEEKLAYQCYERMFYDWFGSLKPPIVKDILRFIFVVIIYNMRISFGLYLFVHVY